MKINELKAGANNVTITATVSKKDDAREVTTKLYMQNTIIIL